MLTSRKPRPLVREIAQRDTRLIVIATEGEHTEKIYFNSFKSRRVQIVTLPTVDGHSAPAAVADRLALYAEEYQLSAEDELWIVVDRDRWPEKDLSEIGEDCYKDIRKGFALSNPCFEVWLSFHYTDQIPEDLKSKNAEKFFRALHGSFQKSNYDTSTLMPRVQDAINRARAKDTEGGRWPSPPGSRVYLLVESLLR